MEEILKGAEEKNVKLDDYLMRHVANIVKRDILNVHENFVNMSDQKNILFELLNSTNWNSVRLKPPCNENIGWRV